MGERKVLNKYYPPDFDPSRLPRRKKQTADAPTPLRFMLPISIRCTSCKSFMGRGLKFNATKHVASEKYLGIKIYRFSMKCIECGSKFWIRTNPKDASYDTEKGATKNYEPWKAKEEKEDVEKELKSGEGLDVMEKMELKVLDAKEEIEDLDLLEELKSRNERGARIRKEDLWKVVREKHGVVVDKSQVELDIERESRLAFENQSRNSVRKLDGVDNDENKSNERIANPFKESDNASNTGKRNLEGDRSVGRAKQRVRVTQLRVKKRNDNPSTGEEKIEIKDRQTAPKSLEHAPKPLTALGGLEDYASDTSSSV